MFGWATGSSLPPVSSEPLKERPPPAAATKPDFPIYDLPNITGKGTETCLKSLYQDLASIKKPQDISLARFNALNLKVEPNIAALDIVPKDCRVSTAMPWEESKPADPADEPILMGNGNPYPPESRFDVLKNELLLDNDDAFREVARLPPVEGKQRARVTQTRKFWTGLERMAQYWDDSLDHYFERPATPESKEVLDQDERSDKMDVDNPLTSQTPSVTMYTGRRIGTGHEMPEDARDETVRAFVEMAAWPFGCQVIVPMVPPRLSIKTLLFPVRHSFEAARSPKDRQLARRGVMEGPILVAQCRPETSFRNEQDTPGSGVMEVSDLYREVGGMLLCAQERAREGQTEVNPGEGKWWTTTPRWGGAENAGEEKDETNNVDEKPTENGKARKRSKYDHPFTASRRPGGSQKLTNNERWKLVQPGPSHWDRRMRYIQIGKNRESPFDDIYMVSSINHHIAILHLRVHRRYLETLTAGESSFPPDSDSEPWQVLKLRRTKWYDLFDEKDRTEAFEGVWSIFHHSMRTL